MSGPFLLDVNVLVALFDPEHIHHEAAHAWFGNLGAARWATCPLTENGLVRVVSNPGYPGRRTTLKDAIARLAAFCGHKGHVFWADEVTIRDTTRIRSGSIQGHRQLTDVYLLALAVSNGGALVSFDRSIQTAAVLKATGSHLVTLTV